MGPLTTSIDAVNLQFTTAVKNQLHNLNVFSEKALEWLMMEHFQFSARNAEFLAIATGITYGIRDTGVVDELHRNYNEEKGHARIYKKALFEMGTDVDTRIEFKPTSQFFAKLLALITASPSSTLGTMYATETAAIFEHEVFRDISAYVVKLRNKPWQKSRLKAFHDMHLNGVEQSHKDELGKFVDIDARDINKEKLLSAANEAIDAMVIWWNAMLKQAKKL